MKKGHILFLVIGAMLTLLLAWVGPVIAGPPRTITFTLGPDGGRVIRYVTVEVDDLVLGGNKGPTYTAALRTGNHHVKVVWNSDGVNGALGYLETWIHTPDTDAIIEIPFPKATIDFIGFDAAGWGGGGQCTVRLLPMIQGQVLQEEANPGNRNLYHSWFLKSSQETATADILGGCYSLQVACGTCPGSTSQCLQKTSEQFICVGYDDATFMVASPPHP